VFEREELIIADLDLSEIDREVNDPGRFRTLRARPDVVYTQKQDCK